MPFWKKRKSKIDPIYVVIRDGDDEPTESQAMAVLQVLVKSGKLEAPDGNSIIARINYQNMPHPDVDGRFMLHFGNFLTENFPELRSYIEVSGGVYHQQDGVDMNIVGTHAKVGYIRVVHVKIKP